MRVKYLAIGPVRKGRKGYVRDVVLYFGDERVYVVLFSDSVSPVFLEDEGVVDIDLRVLRAKIVPVKDQSNLVKNILDDITKTKEV